MVTHGTLDAAYEALFRSAETTTDKPVLETLERECILRALQRTNGNQAAAAKLLGLNRATLRKRLDAYGL
ncbi:MAG: Fis family transcriptional regulator [Bdellovibrionaceae bacterium]|nr:Fis family transcriptional regulator [Pseudobdellovibrionaceae bacterium]